ncbi:MAG: hypothetical protein JWN15_2938 [Firmicutes bacterium]|nr:hypothetical protein [Bacillota bacterium]
MQCEQIATYLKDYADGVLPPFKRSWVVQHLAGCKRCGALLAEAQRARHGSHRAPVAAAGDATLAAGGPAWVDLQRPVPPQLRRALALFTVLLLLALVWLALLRAGAPNPAPAPDRAARELRFTAPSQSRGGVTLLLKSLVANGDQLWATFRFDGTAIAPTADNWVVLGLSGEQPHSYTPVVTPDAGGVNVQVLFRLPASQSGFRMTLAGVNQQTFTRWTLPLPSPPDRLEAFSGTLPGAPLGVALRRYGLVDGVLQLELSLSEKLRGELPKLSLRDDNGVLLAPSGVVAPGNSNDVTLQYAVPKLVRLPMQLVGNIRVQNYLGPWSIQTNVVR